MAPGKTEVPSGRRRKPAAPAAKAAAKPVPKKAVPEKAGTAAEGIRTCFLGVDSMGLAVLSRLRTPAVTGARTVLADSRAGRPPRGVADAEFVFDRKLALESGDDAPPLVEARGRLGESLSEADLVFLFAEADAGETAPLVRQVVLALGGVKKRQRVLAFTCHSQASSRRSNNLTRRLGKVCDSVVNYFGAEGLVRRDRGLVAPRRRAVEDIAAFADAVAVSAMEPGTLSLDLADLVAVMTARGKILWGRGEGSGEDRAARAVGAALDDGRGGGLDLAGAGVLMVMTTGDENLKMRELEIVNRAFLDRAGEQARVFSGVGFDGAPGRVRIFFLASGLPLPRWKADNDRYFRVTEWRRK
ncbi:MAG: hypothetical protein LBO05_02440 [Deltaproteobacteria bacterium]|jgi:cell division protein FtsZ|nr:hypothetical protein [Deltaproteobacteria bacterium]